MMERCLLEGKAAERDEIPAARQRCQPAGHSLRPLQLVAPRSLGHAARRWAARPGSWDGTGGWKEPEKHHCCAWPHASAGAR